MSRSELVHINPQLNRSVNPRHTKQPRQEPEGKRYDGGSRDSKPGHVPSGQRPPPPGFNWNRGGQRRQEDVIGASPQPPTITNLFDCLTDLVYH